MTRRTKPPTGGRHTYATAPPTVRSGARRPPVHEADARLNARPHTTRLLVQAIDRRTT